MKIQEIQDNKGKTTGVFIPINDWNKLKKQFKNLDDYEVNNKEQILLDIKQAIKELHLIKTGKLKVRPAKELLNKL